MFLVDRLLEIHTKNFPVRHSDFSPGITRFLGDYGYQSDDQIPEWMRRLVLMVVNEQPGSFLFDEVGSDMGSLFEELRAEFGWQIDDSGETVRLTFPVSQIQVLISREAINCEGHSCSSCVVRTISPAQELG